MSLRPAPPYFADWQVRALGDAIGPAAPFDLLRDDIEAELLLERVCHGTAHAVVLPAQFGCHLLDGGALGPAQHGNHLRLLGVGARLS